MSTLRRVFSGLLGGEKNEVLEALRSLLRNPLAPDLEQKRSLIAAAWARDDWPLHGNMARVLASDAQADFFALPFAALAEANRRAIDRPAYGDRKPGSTFHSLRSHMESRFAQQPLSMAQAEQAGQQARLMLIAALRYSSWTGTLPAFVEREPHERRAGWAHLFAGCLHFWQDDRPAENIKPRRLAAFRKQSEESLARIGVTHFAETLRQWLSTVDVGDEGGRGRGEDFLAGSMLAASILPDRSTAAEIGRLLERCYRSTGREGLGTAAMEALARMPGDVGLATLVNARLGRRSGQRRRESLFRRLARERGTTLDELLDVGSPDLGLDEECRLVQMFGDYRAVVHPKGSRQGSVTWYAPNGKALKSTPKAIREVHGNDVKRLSRTAKALGAALLGRIDALERSYLTLRGLPFDRFQSRLREQPVERHLAERLIWRAERGEISRSFLLRDGNPKSSDGSTVELPDDTVIRLWHPLHDKEEDAATWRRRILELEIVQPFKQAHRETYVVTDAERTTGNYSNRFAGHILRQHQFAQLLSQRGWRYGLQGNFDCHNEAELPLPEHDLVAGFNVDQPGFEQERYELFRYIGTDRVHFHRPGHSWIPLPEVPRIVFSECMRNVDLAVAVASIGTDPEWTDRGHDDAMRHYWHRYASGPLEAVGEVRRELLASILPRLAIANRLSLNDRWLNVRGNRADYRIHLRSLQVEVARNQRHLCIIPKGRSTDLALPFEGDEGLSILLSKAHMLVSDDKIRDRGIKEQIDSALASS